MLRSNVVLLSFAAPSTAGFVGISPKPRQNRGAQEEAAIEPPSGARARLTDRRDSDLIMCFL